MKVLSSGTSLLRCMGERKPAGVGFGTSLASTAQGVGFPRQDLCRSACLLQPLTNRLARLLSLCG